MRTLLENLGNVGTEVSSEVVKNNGTSIHISIEVAITKGSLRQTFTGWATVERLIFKGFYSVEVIDYEESTTSIGTLKVDSLQALAKTLNASGLSSLAKELVIDDTEVRKAFYRATEEMEEVKMLFKDCKCFDLLSVEEKVIEKLKAVTPENIRNTYFTKDNEKPLIQDLLDLEVITQKDIKNKVKELSKN
jgi:hypothetical protein